jgi:RNA polymerase sigma-70 factor, ECF subfamily
MDFFAFDDEYVRRLRGGDRWTEEHYFRYFKLFLTLKLRGRGVAPGDLDDVIQEVHSRVFKELRGEGGPREGHKFGAYVNSICNHVMQESARKQRDTRELEDIFSSPDDALRDIITKETEARVHRTLASLGQRDAGILRAVFIQQEDKDQICGRFGVTREYLRVLVHRALEKFRDEYDQPVKRFRDSGHYPLEKQR